jgi:hypothetical protein
LVAKVRVPTLEEAAKIGDRAIMSVVQVLRIGWALSFAVRRSTHCPDE